LLDASEDAPMRLPPGVVVSVRQKMAESLDAAMGIAGELAALVAVGSHGSSEEAH
jgi:hypothetical protein